MSQIILNSWCNLDETCITRRRQFLNDCNKTVIRKAFIPSSSGHTCILLCRTCKEGSTCHCCQSSLTTNYVQTIIYVLLRQRYLHKLRHWASFNADKSSSLRIIIINPLAHTEKISTGKFTWQSARLSDTFKSYLKLEEPFMYN